MSVVCRVNGSSGSTTCSSLRSLVSEACEDFHDEGLLPLVAFDGRFHLASQFDDDYEWTNREAGRGLGGIVRIAQRIGGNTEVSSLRCVKCYRKRSQVGRDPAMIEEAIKRECSIYLRVDHPNIARLLDVYEDDFHVSIVMEYCQGGTLEARIKESVVIAEATAKPWFLQLLLAVSYLHGAGIAHRDVKPLNIVFADLPCNSSVKLIDFGESATCPDIETGDMLRGMAGTPNYLAPEMLESRADNGCWYSTKCDLWATGITLYKMLSGKEPFMAPGWFMCAHGDSDDECDADEDWMIDIRQGNYSFDEEIWCAISSDARGLVQKLLIVDQEQRPSAERILHHAWLSEQLAVRRTIPLCLRDSLPSVLRGFRSFASASVMLRSSLRTMCYSKVEFEASHVLPIFSSFDRRGVGVINAHDFTTTIRDAGGSLSDSECVELFDQLIASVSDEASISKNAEKVLSYSEFMAALIPMQLGHDSFIDATQAIQIDAESVYSSSMIGHMLPDSRCGYICGEATVEELLRQISEFRYRSVCVGGPSNPSGFVDLADVNQFFVSKFLGVADGVVFDSQRAFDSVTGTNCGDIVNFSGRSQWTPRSSSTSVSDVLCAVMRHDVRRVPIVSDDGQVETVITPTIMLALALQIPEWSAAMEMINANTFESREKVQQTCISVDDTVLNAMRRIAENNLWLGPVVEPELSSIDAEGAVAIGVLAAADILHMLELDASTVLSMTVMEFLAWRNSHSLSRRVDQYPYINITRGCNVRSLAEGLLTAQVERIFLSSDMLSRIIGVASARDILAMAWPTLSQIHIHAPIGAFGVGELTC